MHRLILIAAFMFIAATSYGQANVNATIVNTATTVPSTALEASRVMKAGAGKLVSFHAYSTTAQFILVMNSATVPGDGPVTLLCPPIKMAAGANYSVIFSVPLTASTGISVCSSSTGTFTKTLGAADCVFMAQIQ